MDLTGRTALVTGGTGLLGSEFVKTLALAGARVTVFDIRTTLLPVLHEMVEEGFDIDVFKVDITNPKAVETGFRLICAAGDSPTILINCAGLDTVIGRDSLEPNGPFEHYSEEAWDSVIDSHLKGAFLVSREFFRWFLATDQNKGSIINISSTYGLVAPDQSIYEYRRERGEDFYKPVAYSVAKAGMIGLTKWLAEYGGLRGIRVNTLVPSGTDAGQGLDQEFVQKFEKRTMLGRMASPRDYSGAVLFLASDASSYMTGATLVVDGGWIAK